MGAGIVAASHASRRRKRTVEIERRYEIK